MKRPLAALLLALALAPCSSAQRIEPDVLFSDFDNAPSTFSFGDATLSFPAGNGEYGTAALRASIDPAGGNGFAGFGVSRGAVNASAAKSLTFLVRSSFSSANGSAGRTGEGVLEIKLKQGGVEYQAVRRLAPATGYQFVSVPITAFRNGAAGLDASAVTDVIFAVGGATGPAFTIDIENLGFDTSPVALFNDFDDGDFGNESLFFFSQSGAGITRTAAGPGAEGTPNAVLINYNGSTAGEFAAFGFNAPGNGIVDASGTAFLEFFYRDVDDGTVLEIKLVDQDGDQATSGFLPFTSGSGFQRRTLALSSFSVFNPAGNGVLDLNRIKQIVIEIRDRGTGPSSIGIDQVSFRARRVPATQTMADGAGYRLLSAPVAGITVGTLASQNLVQGVAGSYPGAASNLFTAYTGGTTSGGYAPATSTSDALAPGAGFFWYLYDTTRPSVPTLRPTPFTLFAQGDAATTNVTVSQPRNVGAPVSSFHMVGNPFTVPFALSGLSETTSGGSLQTTFSAWDPAGNTYRMLTAANQAAVWQGFFVEVVNAAADPTFVFSAAARVDPAAPPFYGRADEAQLAFSLHGEIDGAAVTDEAALVRFAADATTGWDRHDASKLIPITPVHALVAFAGTGPDGAARRQSALSLPLDGSADVPLSVTATADGRFTLSWTGTLPGGVSAELRDASTGASHDLAVAGSVAVDATAGAWTSPFTVHVSSRAVAGEPGADAPERLGAPAPNPSAGIVQMPLQLGTAQTVRVVAYDVLGRQVAASEALQPAGASMLRTDLSGLPAGVYVIRVHGETLSGSRRVTVAR